MQTVWRPPLLKSQSTKIKNFIVEFHCQLGTDEYSAIEAAVGSFANRQRLVISGVFAAFRYYKHQWEIPFDELKDHPPLLLRVLSVFETIVRFRGKNSDKFEDEWPQMLVDFEHFADCINNITRLDQSVAIEIFDNEKIHRQRDVIARAWREIAFNVFSQSRLGGDYAISCAPPWMLTHFNKKPPLDWCNASYYFKIGETWRGSSEILRYRFISI